MNLQYISDNHGQKISVVIPIQEWNNLKSKYKELEAEEIDDTNIFGLTEEHKKILDERRAKHLSGESKSYTLEEVKAHARASRTTKR